MLEDEQLILARHARPGMRIAINSIFSLNPSMEHPAQKGIVMNVEVSHVRPEGKEVLIEARTRLLFKIPGGATIKKLHLIPDDTDLLKPAPKFAPDTFNHISID